MPSPGKFQILRIAVVAVIASGILQACSPQDSSRETLQATLLPQPMPLAEFRLTDHDGGAFTRASLRGQWSLLFFGFTHCPDICPATLQQLAAAREKLASSRPEAPVPRIVLISVDPERDTAEALRTYVTYFGENILGVSGDLAELQTLTRQLGIFFRKDPDGAGDYTVSHSTAVVLINPDAEFHAVLAAPLSLESMLHDLPILMTAR